MVQWKHQRESLLERIIENREDFYQTQGHMRYTFFAEMRASYNGYYPSFPSLWRGFDSRRPLQKNVRQWLVAIAVFLLSGWNLSDGIEPMRWNSVEKQSSGLFLGIRPKALAPRGWAFAMRTRDSRRPLQKNVRQWLVAIAVFLLSGWNLSDGIEPMRWNSVDLTLKSGYSNL